MAGLRRSVTCLWAKYITLICNCWAELWNIWSILPFRLCFSFILSLFNYLTDIFIAGSWFLYLWCLSVLMNFKTIFWLILLIMLCIFVLTCLWFSSCLAHKCIPCCSPNSQPRKHFRNPKSNLLYWVLFEIVLACFFSLGNNFWHKQKVYSIYIRHDAKYS